MNKLRRMFFRVQRKNVGVAGTARLFNVAIEKTGKQVVSLFSSLKLKSPVILLNYLYFQNQNAGYSSSVGLFLFLIIMILGTIVRNFLEKKAEGIS